MTDVFDNNLYMDNFKNVFGNNAEESLMNGQDYLLDFTSQLNLQPFIDRLETTGQYWWDLHEIIVDTTKLLSYWR